MTVMLGLEYKSPYLSIVSHTGSKLNSVSVADRENHFLRIYAEDV
jgi:hypothetical protein